ncbi:MAG: ISAs1 family transposase [Planctomycetia bacterium]|nr:ISAs1 family transposase [Planctomycetia bacterium]
MVLLEGLHDPRGAQGERPPPPAPLGPAAVAMLAGMTGYEAIVRYGEGRGWDFLRHLGLATRWGLPKATDSRASRRIDVADFEARVGRWAQARRAPGDAPHLCVDGKAARGGRDGDTPGAHRVSAYAPDVKAALARLRVGARTSEHKAARELLGALPSEGEVVTGDARFTRRDVGAAVAGGGGDDVLPVKGNRPTPGTDIAAAFAGPEAGLSPPPGRAPRGRGRAGDGGRQGARPDRGAVDRGHVVAGRVPGLGLARVRAGVPPDAGGRGRGEGRDRGGDGDHEAAARARRGEGVAEADPGPLGGRQRAARGARRGAARGRESDQEGGGATLHVPPGGVARTPVNPKVRMKRPCPDSPGGLQSPAAMM